MQPVISEYMKDLDWEEGVGGVVKQELEGIADIEGVFRWRPGAFVQPGSSWAPQAVYSMKSMRISIHLNILSNLHYYIVLR